MKEAVDRSRNGRVSLERDTFEGVEYFWREPEPRADASGDGGDGDGAMVFVAHGCGHSATDWFARDDDLCRDCIGLPEEMAIVDIAARRMNMAVLAISSADREGSKCWSPARDGPRVAKVLAHKVRERRRSGRPREPGKPPPIFAFGASSGGFFVASALPAAVKQLDAPDDPCELAGIVSQIAPPVNDENGLIDDIPAVFITMDRDLRTDAIVERYVKTRGRNKKHIRLPPLSVTDTFFHDRLGNGTIDVDTSKRMVQALYQRGFFVAGPDPGTYTLPEERDPRDGSNDWRTVLRPFVPTDVDTFLPDESPVSEIMNVAYAVHEISRDGVQEALQYLLEMHLQKRHSS
jgi:hypothetical protein